MKKFMLITFGFLGWAFYEMSGGAAFEPASARLADSAPVSEASVPDEPEVAEAPPAPASDNSAAIDAVVAEVATAEPAPTPFVDTDPPLRDPATPAAINLTSADPVASDVPGTAPQAPVPAPQVIPDSQTAPASAGSSLSSSDTPAIIPSLIAPAQNNIATLQTAGASDIRAVSGSRVNVRGGPGTDFGIVNRLTRGARVEVLEDDGSGWVRMRDLDSRTEGWMADFLLDAG